MSGEQPPPPPPLPIPLLPPPSVTYEDLVEGTFEFDNDEHENMRGGYGGERGGVGKKRKIPNNQQQNLSFRFIETGNGNGNNISSASSNAQASGQNLGQGQMLKRPATPDGLQRPGSMANRLETQEFNNNFTNGGLPSLSHSNDTSYEENDVKPLSNSTNKSNHTPLIRKKLTLSPARKLMEFRKELFVKRKSNFISLYIDAQNALSQTENSINSALNSTSSSSSLTKNSTANTTNIKNDNNSYSSKIKTDQQNQVQKKKKSNLPDVSEFEKLLPALEDVNINSWTPDRQGWKLTQQQLQQQSQSDNDQQPKNWRNSYRYKFRRFKVGKINLGSKDQKKIERKGWFPEGSFEFELECKASSTLRAKAKEQTSLLKLANELRALIISANRAAPVVTTTTTSSTSNNNDDEDKLPSKTRRKLANKDTNISIPSNITTTPTAKEESQPMSTSQSKDSNETKTTTTGGAGGGGQGSNKKKPKKKKRSVLANQSNPHHVDNYRPSRTVSPHGDPYEPYSSHLSLFNPPSMMFLATRTRKKVNNQQDQAETINMDVRPNEDDFICCFCEYDLYYSTESRRKQAIRRRKKEIKRKELIKNKAKNVAEGKKGSLKNNNNDGDSDYDSQDDDNHSRSRRTDNDDDYEDEEDVYEDDDADSAFAGDDNDCHGDDGHGRCTCGRRVKKPKPDKDKDRDKGYG
ncbi:uncharacterized protein L201_005571 [Kwoniella dendrophila CBS 6074]|uniref:Uncharacterized protein n=1 Tax=Kwoniella dendrophila CBS 6074 TaxID=1295534 RepID=A0AAX4K1I0_9TREE